MRDSGGDVMRVWLSTNGAHDPVYDSSTGLVKGLGSMTIQNVKAMVENIGWTTGARIKQADGNVNWYSDANTLADLKTVRSIIMHVGTDSKFHGKFWVDSVKLDRRLTLVRPDGRIVAVVLVPAGSKQGELVRRLPSETLVATMGGASTMLSPW